MRVFGKPEPVKMKKRAAGSISPMLSFFILINTLKGGIVMNEFLLSFLASLMAAIVIELIKYLLDKR